MELRSTKGRLKYLLNGLLVKLDSLSDEKNFFENINSVKTGIFEIQTLGNELKTNFTANELKDFEDEFNFKTKQIKEKFDNIIEDKKQEILQVSEQINKLQNSKKLAVYR